jgi:hypothetical protein
MSENQDNPEENLTGKVPEHFPGAKSNYVGDSLPPTPATRSLTKQPQQAMEVHHHGHVHEKTKWKEYFFQFLMLFLAVFLGFLAENFRENLAEKKIEKEYIESLITDLSSDNDIANRNAGSIFEQTKKIDTLQDLFLAVLENVPKKDSIIEQCYIMSQHLNTFYSEFFNERTITQLLSSGNMRLIKKEDVPDKIMDYHSFIKFVEVQKQLYINSINACVQSMYNIYDITFLKTNLKEDDQFHYNILHPDKFITTDPNDFKKFIALLENTKIVAFTYKNYLVDMMNKSEELHSYLTGKYNLKE